jgi:D-threonate/D-erythronate kinase
MGPREPNPVPHTGPSSQHEPGLPARILIVADDLTGACDAAAAFRGYGRRIRVLLDASACESPNIPADVLALTAESRTLPADNAGEQVANCIARMEAKGPGALLFQKIDSAARGNLVTEINAALRASSAALALVTPAFPDAGRTVTGGVLAIRDWSGQDATVNLLEMFRANRIDTAILQTGPEDELLPAIKRAVANGVRVLLCDAVEQTHLDRLAAAALRLPQPVLWAGSAGLARALAAQLPSPGAHPTEPPARRSGRTVLFTGTPHPVTVLQVAELERNETHSSHSRSIHRLVGPSATPEFMIATFSAEKPAALILTGGETASFVLRTLGATGIHLAGEIAPGIPWGMIEDGMAAGCTVVTKSGGFGQRDALVRAFQFCECGSEALSAP